VVAQGKNSPSDWRPCQSGSGRIKPCGGRYKKRITLSTGRKGTGLNLTWRMLAGDQDRGGKGFLKVKLTARRTKQFAEQSQAPKLPTQNRRAAWKKCSGAAARKKRTALGKPSPVGVLRGAGKLSKESVGRLSGAEEEVGRPNEGGKVGENAVALQQTNS